MRISDWSSDVCSSDLITLTPNAEVGDRELVSLGIPFAPGELTDAALVRIVDGNGVEVPAFVKPTLRWHWLDDSIRAVKVQFFARSEERRVGKARVSTFRSRWSSYI